MLFRDYERAKDMARNCTDEGLSILEKGYDRVGTITAIGLLASFAALMWLDDLLGLLWPSLMTSHPQVHWLCTLVLPALAFAIFFGRRATVDNRRDVLALARKIKRNA